MSPTASKKKVVPVVNKAWLKDVPADKTFYCQDGQVLKNLDELVVALRQMSQDTFSHHVNDGKNDFSSWIGEVIGDTALSKDMRKAASHSAAANIVETRLAALKTKR